jgi:hypothetical protein
MDDPAQEDEPQERGEHEKDDGCNDAALNELP